jgi:hypothetical protein
VALPGATSAANSQDPLCSPKNATKTNSPVDFINIFLSNVLREARITNLSVTKQTNFIRK